MSSSKMEGDTSGKNVAFRPRDNEAYITYFGKMDCDSPDTNFAFMTCSGSVLCFINIWADNFGDDVHLQVLEQLWQKERRLTSDNVYLPVRLCLSLREVRESLAATLPEDASALTSLFWPELAAFGSPCSPAMWKPALVVMGRPWINDPSELDSVSQGHNVKCALFPDQVDIAVWSLNCRIAFWCFHSGLRSSGVGFLSPHFAYTMSLRET